jgi:Fe-S cluster assembly iron-binding protein IscA
MNFERRIETKRGICEQQTLLEDLKREVRYEDMTIMQHNGVSVYILKYR